MSSIKTLAHRQSIGVLVLDKDGAPQWAHGLASDPAVQQTAIAALAKSRTGQGDAPAETLLSIAVQDPAVQLLALVIRDGSSTVLLMRPAEAASPLFGFIGAVPFATEIFSYMISNPYQAMTVADAAGKMCFISEVHERFLGLERGEAIGRDASDIIPNSRLAEVARSGKAEIAQLQTMRGVTRVVNRLPIRRDGEVVGAIGQVLFKEPESIFRMHRSVALRRAEQQVDTHESLAAGSPLIGRSAPMQRLRREIQTVAHLDIPVLILGESGTGKELVAQAIHRAGSHDEATPLVSLNLAALPATLLEAELFGYQPGAFTGGNRQGQRGRIEQAEGGTLFLDEVGDIPMEMQVKLLRVVEDRRVERLGGGDSHQVNFRLITATNRHMQGLIDAERFRLDLYYRLSGVVLHIPALRHRREDIPELLHHFVRAFCTRNSMPVPTIGSEVIPYLAAQDWPGNVRQLRQRIEEALVFCDSQELRVGNFDRYTPSEEPRPGPAAALPAAPRAEEPGAGNARLKDLERQAVRQAIAESGGNKKRAAEQLGISRSHLYKILGRED
ncbi:sigma-54 interaction domain-containing protein [Achromobacter sp. NPDC058515]|uniref:sigma-54 interaction domain-containing protein n=1 Tax=Achromobacter sp. NPDC058515 TaxID=3346533 RepID=UPI0036656293